MVPPLAIRVLGELEIVRDGQLLALPASKKTRALLGYLVVARGRRQPRQRLCELFWEGPDDPRAALRWSLSKIRPFVDDAAATRLIADRDHVAFEPRGASVDLITVTELGPPAMASTDDLTHAAAMHRGELLESLDLPDCHRYHEWCVGEREAARKLRGAVLATLVERFGTDPETALRYARTRVAIDPLVESAHVAVMGLLARLGRPREAMKQYDSCRRVLLAQLGRAPSKEVEVARAALGQAARAAPAVPSNDAVIERPTLRQLVGRDAECRAATQVLRAAMEGGSRRVLLVSGEPGIGKTHMLAEIAAQAATLGGATLAGRGFEAEMIRPYGAWIEILRSIGLDEAGASLRAELAPLLPELGPPPSETDRNRLFDATGRLLKRSASRAPLVVTIDDIQWLDEASAALLHYLTRSLAESRILFALAARPAEVVANRPVQALLQAVVREGRLARIELSPLDEAATRELARSVDSRLDARQIFMDCGGNPLFCLELARAVPGADGPLPSPSLDGLIAERLSRLDERAADVLPWAAALGHSFSVDTLAALTSLPARELFGALHELERHGVFRVADTGHGGAGYDFAHDLVRRAAYRGMSEPRRRWVHLQVARTLSATSDPDGLLAGDVAHHAALGCDSDLASRAYVAAAERCLRLFAHADASRLAGRGLQHVDQLPMETGVPRRLSLLAVQVHSNQWLRRSHELVAQLSRVATLAEQRGMHGEASRAYYLISFVHSERGDMASAGTHTLQAVARAGHAADADTRQHQLANTARCLALIERDVARAESFLREADALPGIPSARTRMELVFGRGLLRAFAGEDDEAVPLLELAAELAAAGSDHWAQAQALTRLTRLELERGRPHEALARCEQLAPLVAKLTEGSEGPFVAALVVLAKRALGVEDGGVAAEAATAALRSIDSKGQLAYLLNGLAAYDAGVGRVHDARRRALEALRAAETVGQHSEVAVARAQLASLAEAGAERDEAVEWLGACLAGGPDLSARARAAVEAVAKCVGQEGRLEAPSSDPDVQ